MFLAGLHFTLYSTHWTLNPDYVSSKPTNIIFFHACHQVMPFIHIMAEPNSQVKFIFMGFITVRCSVFFVQVFYEESKRPSEESSHTLNSAIFHRLRTDAETFGMTCDLVFSWCLFVTQERTPQWDRQCCQNEHI